MRKNTNIIPIILSGGAGTRLWPMSTKERPKPFVTLPDGQTLIEKTYRRAACIEGVEQVITVANKQYGELCGQEFDKLNLGLNHTLILEPFGRDTAAAITLGALQAKKISGENSILLVLPADHLIEDLDNFIESVDVAINSAQQSLITTFGIKTRYPETGYGYIQAGSEIEPSLCSISRFTEKPNATVAEQFHSHTDYYWNSGIFCFRTKEIFQEFEEHAPHIKELAEKTLENSTESEYGILINSELFEKVEKKSFDYAIMENTKHAAVVKTQFDWKDMGSWYSFSDLMSEDKSKNREQTQSPIFKKNIKGNIVFSSTPGKNIAMIGVSDLVVAETEFGLLIANKNEIQDVKEAAQFFEKPTSP